MRIAICISGHLRCYEELSKFFKERVLNPLEKFAKVDIFIDTWDKQDTENCWSFREKKNIWMDKYIDLNKVKEVFPYKFIRVDSEENVRFNLNLHRLPKFSKEQKLELPIMLYNTHRGNKYGDVWMNFMCYKIYRCCDLKLQYEFENNFQYDFCIRYRPDSIPGKILGPKDFKKDTISVKSVSNNSIADQFWIAESENFNALCFFNQFSETYEPGGLETNLFFHAKKLDLLKFVKVIDFPLQIGRLDAKGNLQLVA